MNTHTQHYQGGAVKVVHTQSGNKRWYWKATMEGVSKPCRGFAGGYPELVDSQTAALDYLGRGYARLLGLNESQRTHVKSLIQDKELLSDELGKAKADRLNLRRRCRVQSWVIWSLVGLTLAEWAIRLWLG